MSVPPDDSAARDGALSRLARQDMLTLLLERTEQGYWLIDNDLLTIDANPAMCRMLRTTREAMLGTTIYDWVDAENEAIFRHHVMLRAQGVAEGYTIALRRADGTLVDCYNNATPVFDGDGRKIGAIGLFSDISAQRRAERQVRLTSELLAHESRVLERTLDTLDQGVLSIDAHGRVNAWNRRFLELLKLPESLMEGNPSFIDIIAYQIDAGLLDGAELEISRKRLVAMRQADGSPRPLGVVPRDHYRRTTPDGREIEITTFPGPDGGLVRTYSDITARVDGEQALIAAKEEAERANRAKSDFLSRISHELRTPMNAILGFAQLLESDPRHPLDAVQATRVQELLRGGRHLLALINDVLDVTRVETGALTLVPEPVAVAPLVDDCLHLVAPMAQACGVRLPARAPGGTLHVHADAVRLKQVLLNLLGNAIKYNRPGGEVRLSVRGEGSRVRIAVSDDGPGIAAADRPRLFQAFERLSAQHGAVEGSGIGLALSKQLTEAMRGEIGIEDAADPGATFWVRLPRVASAPMAGAPVAPATSGAPAAADLPPPLRRRVLYIEDNPTNQVLMEGMLAQRPGVALSMATWPEEGLALARREQPHLVLLDIQLPGIDGYEVLRRLRADPETAAIPVVAVSANAMAADVQAALAAGFDHYLAKPLDLVELLALVDRLLQADD